jgi:hypothetical protein
LLVNFMDRNFIVGSVMVIAVATGATIAMQLRGESAVEPTVPPPKIEVHERTYEPLATMGMNRTEGHPSSPIHDRRDDSLLAHVEHKYRYLLADVESEHVDELKRRLLAREGEANIARRESTDASVGELLSPRDREYYDALKDSDLEQHHLSEYVGGINNVAPLDKEQERQVLEAKMRQKQRYAAALRDIGIERDTLSATERAYAHEHVAEALDTYLDDFLLEVSPALTPEQLTLLRNYEATELKRELERMQQRINAK